MATNRKSHKSRQTQDEQSGIALATTPEQAVPPGPAQGISSIPQEQPKEKQFWYRPAGGGTHKKFLKILVMRAAGRDVKWIAKKLDTTEAMVRQIEYLGKKNGWVDDDGEPVDIEAELAMNIDRKVVRNISASLDGGMTNYQTHEMTLAAAKGRGIFKSEAAQGAVAPNAMAVSIQVIMPPVGVADQTIIESNVGGTPAYLEGEVENDRVLPSAQTDPAV